MTIVVNYILPYYLLDGTPWINQSSQFLFGHPNMQNCHTSTHPLKPNVPPLWSFLTPSGRIYCPLAVTYCNWQPCIVVICMPPPIGRAVFLESGDGLTHPGSHCLTVLDAKRFSTNIDLITAPQGEAFLEDQKFILFQRRWRQEKPYIKSTFPTNFYSSKIKSRSWVFSVLSPYGKCLFPIKFMFNKVIF